MRVVLYRQKMLTLGFKTRINLKRTEEDHSYSWGSRFIDRHPVMANILIIIIISLLGIYAAYLTTAIFTKHGRTVQVPGVENMSYTDAIRKLHDAGLRVDIRDSLFREDIRPGFVIEQFPKAKSTVKPGRKIFLYINSVHPKEVIIDDDNHPGEFALKGESFRSAQAKLEELGFKNIKMVKVLGTWDRVVKVMANGRPVRKMQKVPVNAAMVIEVADGRLNDIQDSLRNAELLEYYRENPVSYEEAPSYSPSERSIEYTEPAPAQSNPSSESTEENEQYF